MRSLLNRIFLPNLKISHDVGFSGGNVWLFRLWKIITVTKGKEKTVCLGIDKESYLRARWCRAVSFGGTTLGIGKYNYWVDDECFVGKIFKRIF